MKKKKVDKILVEQTKRRKHILCYACIIVAFIILTLSFASLYLFKNKDYYVKYNEYGNIDYRVYLKENEYFKEKYLERGNKYIASLIDYVETDFNYNMDVLDNKADFKYSYKVVAEVNVKERTGVASLYNFEEEILNKDNNEVVESGHLNINETIKIDYNHYNELIKSFVKEYDLDEAVSTLKLNMYINIVGSCDDKVENKTNNSVLSLEIPLTTKTMDIELSNNLLKNDNNIMACSKKTSGSLLYLFIAVFMFVVALSYISALIKYVVSTRTAEDVYQKELNKILNNYHSYIQKINNGFDLSKYQKLRIDSFTDMLEIRDTLQQPILMAESKDKDGVIFIIPSNTKILYMYSIRVSDIKKQMQEAQNITE